jgi:alkylation response protein AidB-like acyl-CoA dehydrogenase
MHDAGIKVSDPDLKMGNHAQLTADVALGGVFVGDDHVVGSVGGGLRTALGTLALGRIGIGTIGVAMAQRAFDIATAYTVHRNVYGKPIAANQHWQFRFAEHAIEIEAARSLCHKAAWLTDADKEPGAFAAMAKIKARSRSTWRVMPFNVAADTVSSAQCQAPIKAGRSNRFIVTPKLARSMRAPTKCRNGLSLDRFLGGT